MEARSLSAGAARLLEPPPSLRICQWCDAEIPDDARADAIYCSKSCRQASHRFRRGYGARPATSEPITVAYADPPYPGLSKRYYEEHRDYAGEVDHDELLERLEYYRDGWALSTNSRSLAWLLRRPGMPDDVWVAAWTRGARPSRSARPLQAWEPVIVRGGRHETPEATQERLDALVYTARARGTDPNRVTGAKPAEFLWWLFALLGLEPGDTLDDLYPGSGGVRRAWTIFNEGRPQPSLSPATATRRGDRRDTARGPLQLLLEV